MSDFFGKLKSGAEKVAFEADKMSRVNHAKGDLDKLKTQIQAQYTKLGEMYYTQRTCAGVSGPAYDEICQAIADLGQQVEAKNEAIQRMNAENYMAPGSQPAAPPAKDAPTPAPTQFMPPAPVQNASSTKCCPNCGKEMTVAVKFCPDCGTKM